MKHKNKKLKVVNFFGPPCAGKSTAAADLFRLLKRNWVNVEQAPEHAKDLVLSRTAVLLKDQALVFANQHHKLYRLRGVADIAITDSPVILSALYAPKNYPASFMPFVLDMYNQFDNINYYIHRKHPYSEIGRVHTEKEAANIDIKLQALLKQAGIQYQDVDSGNYLPEYVLSELQEAHPELFPPIPQPVVTL